MSEPTEIELGALGDRFSHLFNAALHPRAYHGRFAYTGATEAKKAAAHQRKLERHQRHLDRLAARAAKAKGKKVRARKGRGRKGRRGRRNINWPNGVPNIGGLGHHKSKPPAKAPKPKQPPKGKTAQQKQQAAQAAAAKKQAAAQAAAQKRQQAAQAKLAKAQAAAAKRAAAEQAKAAKAKASAEAKGKATAAKAAKAAAALKAKAAKGATAKSASGSTTRTRTSGQVPRKGKPTGRMIHGYDPLLPKSNDHDRITRLAVIYMKAVQEAVKAGRPVPPPPVNLSVKTARAIELAIVPGSVPVRSAGDGPRITKSSGAYGAGKREPKTRLTAANRQRWAKTGVALPDGSFPIPDRAHLIKAMRAVGRAAPDKRPQVRAHIARRARALGVRLPTQ